MTVLVAAVAFVAGWIAGSGLSVYAAIWVVALTRAQGFDEWPIVGGLLGGSLATAAAVIRMAGDRTNWPDLATAAATSNWRLPWPLRTFRIEWPFRATPAPVIAAGFLMLVEAVIGIFGLAVTATMAPSTSRVGDFAMCVCLLAIPAAIGLGLGIPLAAGVALVIAAGGVASGGYFALTSGSRIDYLVVGLILIASSLLIIMTVASSRDTCMPRRTNRAES